MTNIAIFASGAGTNAENIIKHFKGHPAVRVALIVSNKRDAGVLSIAANHHIPYTVVSEKPFFASEDFIKHLGELQINFIVLAGFLWKVPDLVLKAFHNRIVNIHPALLPKFGGKGMHGMNVHRAVVLAKEKEAGITIHFVNEEYDAGEIIFQKSVPVSDSDTAESLAKKVQRLEHDHYPKVIEKLLT